MDKRSGLQPSKVALSVALAITFSSPALSSILDATNTLYYYASNNSNGNNSDFTNYEQVNIKTNAIASTNGLKGWGIYLDRTGYKFNTLNIVTNGMLSDGIHSKNAGGLIEINDYEVLTTSYSSDGINLGRELASNSSKVLINNTATIKAAGMGVRANASVNNANAVSTIIINGKTAIETTSAGSNVAGYGVYAGKDTEANSTAVKGRAEIFLNGESTIKTVGNNAHAVYARDAGTISLNNVTISASGNNAHGLFASSPTPDQQAVINLASDVAIITHTGNVIYATGEHGVIQSYDSASARPASGVYRLDGNIVADNGGQVALNMAEGSHFSGVANSNELPTSTSAAGKITLSLSGANSLWHMTGDSVLSSLTLNDAVLNYAAPAEGDAFTPKTLVVAGNYGGQGGVLALNTVLGDDNSLTDKLVVMGDTDGSTKVRINNLGGGGAQTVEGIEIIEVAGESNGIFEKEGRIVAGAYDYDVRKKAGNWYLTSLLPTEPDPEPDPEPIPEPIPEPEPEPGPVPGPEPEPTPTPEPGGRHQVRPEFGSYLANLYSANTLFATRLHDRLGETQYTDLLTGEQRVTSMWMRHVGGHTRFNDATGTLKTQSNRYVLQIGGDIAQWQSAGSDRWHLGLMAGYGNSQSNTRSTLNNYRSTGKVTGYSAGLYTTWYANEADKTGTYLDAWALYNWFDNQVTGQGLATEKYKSKGVSASLEAGYSARAGESASGHYSWWLQPKAQVTWMGVKADDHKEANGTRVKDTTRGNLQTRLGLKAYATENVKQKAPREQDFQPFIEANWIHNADDYSVKMDGVENTIRGTKNIGELKLGLEGQIGKNVQLWGNVAQQIGDKGYSDTQGIVGFKYLF